MSTSGRGRPQPAINRTQGPRDAPALGRIDRPKFRVRVPDALLIRKAPVRGEPPFREQLSLDRGPPFGRHACFQIKPMMQLADLGALAFDYALEG